MLSRKGFVCAVVVILVTLSVDRAIARALGDFGQYSPGASLGIATGANPPPGLYFDSYLQWVPFATGAGQLNGVRVNAVNSANTLFWSTGWNLFGGSVSAFVSKSVFTLGVHTPLGAKRYDTVHNTWINPITISWNLGSGWFASAGASFFVPDGTRSANTPNPDYFTFAPRAAVSYLADGWNLTAHLVYEINSPSAGYTGAFAGTPAAPFGVGYRSGDTAILDVTATKRFGPWELGAVGLAKWQTTTDRPGAGASCAAMAAATASTFTCGRARSYGLGGLVGYDFGIATFRMFATHNIFTDDDVGGLSVWARLTVRLWGPDVRGPAPKSSLVTK